MSASPQHSSDSFHAFGRDELAQAQNRETAPEQDRREYLLRARWTRESAHLHGLARLRSWLKLEAMAREARERTLELPPEEACFFAE